MQIIKMPTETWAYLARETGISGAEINSMLEDAFERLTEKIARAGIRTKGQPRAHFRYRSGPYVGFEIGFPIDASDEAAARKVGLSVGKAAPGKALVHIHRGPYTQLGATYREMERRINETGFRARGDLWELYLNDPDECKASDLLTQIVWPVELAHA
jgi:effector-binding domain-containing protein